MFTKGSQQILAYKHSHAMPKQSLVQRKTNEKQTVKSLKFENHVHVL